MCVALINDLTNSCPVNRGKLYLFALVGLRPSKGCSTLAT
jgi:hypothetical protein